MKIKNKIRAGENWITYWDGSSILDILHTGEGKKLARRRGEIWRREVLLGTRQPYLSDQGSKTIRQCDIWANREI